METDMQEPVFVSRVKAIVDKAREDVVASSRAEATLREYEKRIAERLRPISEHTNLHSLLLRALRQSGIRFEGVPIKEVVARATASRVLIPDLSVDLARQWELYQQIAFACNAARIRNGRGLLYPTYEQAMATATLADATTNIYWKNTPMEMVRKIPLLVPESESILTLALDPIRCAADRERYLAAIKRGVEGELKGVELKKMSYESGRDEAALTEAQHAYEALHLWINRCARVASAELAEVEFAHFADESDAALFEEKKAREAKREGGGAEESKEEEEKKKEKKKKGKRLSPLARLVEYCRNADPNTKAFDRVFTPVELEAFYATIGVVDISRKRDAKIEASVQNWRERIESAEVSIQVLREALIKYKLDRERDVARIALSTQPLLTDRSAEGLIPYDPDPASSKGSPLTQAFVTWGAIRATQRLEAEATELMKPFLPVLAEADRYCDAVDAKRAAEGKSPPLTRNSVLPAQSPVEERGTYRRLRYYFSRIAFQLRLCIKDVHSQVTDNETGLASVLDAAKAQYLKIITQVIDKDLAVLDSTLAGDLLLILDAELKALPLAPEAIVPKQVIQSLLEHLSISRLRPRITSRDYNQVHEHMKAVYKRSWENANSDSGPIKPMAHLIRWSATGDLVASAWKHIWTDMKNVRVKAALARSDWIAHGNKGTWSLWPVQRAACEILSAYDDPKWLATVHAPAGLTSAFWRLFVRREERAVDEQPTLMAVLESLERLGAFCIKTDMLTHPSEAHAYL